MNPPAKLSDLMDPIELSSEESIYKFDRKKGVMVVVDSTVLSSIEEGEEPSVADWQKEEVEIAREIVNDAENPFIKPPSKFDFHEYRHMEKFIHSLNNEDAVEQLWRAIKGKGAFRYFKDTATHLGLLDDWWQYREREIKEFVLDWAKDNGVEVIDDVSNRKKNVQE
jgi:hypothetical protein